MAKHLEYISAAKALRAHADPVRSASYRSFFKDSRNDHFLGIPTPVLRRLAKDFCEMPLKEVRKLIQSGIHEERSLANEILRRKFRGGDESRQKQIFDFYLRNKKLIREWDGVDGTAPYIAGPYLLNRDKQVLYELARSRASGTAGSQLSPPGGSSATARLITLSSWRKFCFRTVKT